MNCDPGANPWIAQHFADCVYTCRDYVGFCLGLLAIVCWVFAQLPQFISNFRNKSAEALSPWFLAQWLLGDTFNLTGALMQGEQLPTTTYTAMYFVLSDVFMMMQYIYYGALQRRREKLQLLQARYQQRHRHHHHHHHHHHHGGGGSGADGSGAAGPGGGDAGAGGSGNSSGRGGGGGGGVDGASIGPLYGDGGGGSGSLRRAVGGKAAGSHWGLEGAGGEPPAADSGFEELSEPLLQQHNHHQQQQQQDDQQQQRHRSAGCAPDAQHGGRPARSAAATAAALAVVAVFGFAALAGAPFQQLAGGRPFVGLAQSRQQQQQLVEVQAGVSTDTRWQLPWRQQQQRQQGQADPATLGSSSSSSSIGSSSSSPASVNSSSAGQHDKSSGGGGDDSGGDSGGDDDSNPPWMVAVGTFLGWVSSVLYLASRISQIYKNYKRRSAEGLALAMFVLAAAANMCTGTGILLRTYTWEELAQQGPWLAGSLGTITLDMVILSQSLRYGSKGSSGTAAAAAAAGAGGGGGGGAHHQHHADGHHHPQHQQGSGRRRHVQQQGSGALQAAADDGDEAAPLLPPV